MADTSPHSEEQSKPSLLKHEAQISILSEKVESINSVVSLYTELFDEIKTRLAELESKVKGR